MEHGEKWNMERSGKWNMEHGGKWNIWNMVGNGTWNLVGMEHMEHEADHVADVRVRTTGVPVTVLLTLECNVGTEKPGVSESSVVGQWRPI
jgi:hypothetical protein